MKPADLLRRLRRLANEKGWEIVVAEGGNHTKVTMRGRRSVIQRHAVDLPRCTFKAICKQLDITEADLR